MKNLDNFNQRGWIPGPDEEKKDFEKRIEVLNRFFSYPPEGVDHFLTDSDWKEARETTKHLFDFSPDWIVAHYSNQNLSFFQGAATWISEKEDIRIPLVQLKKKFESGKLMQMYGREEVLAHEAVHAARMQFDEPLFEEIFAYQTSPRFWRRFFGPLFQRPWEAYLFLVLLLIPLGLEIARFFPVSVEPFSFLTLLPLFFFVYLLGRLLFFRFTLSLALKKIAKHLHNPKKKWAVAFRLKDKEIFQFAYMSEKKLTEILKEESSLRWELLTKYFK